MIKDIYFFNAEALAIRLQRDELTEDLAFHHFLLYSILFASYITIPVIVSGTSDADVSWWHELFRFFVLAAVQFWGVRHSYRVNSKGDGRNFFMRWAALSLPVTIQVLFISVLVGAFYGAVVGVAAARWAETAPPFLWEVVGLCFSVIFQFIYFTLMARNLAVASAGTAP